MSTPATLIEERFFGLPKANFDKILGDDYVHKGNCLETLKFKTKSSTGAVVNYKTQYKVTKGETKNDIKQSDELKVLYPFKRFFCQLRIDRSGNVKKHIDLGQIRDLNCFVQLKHNLNLQNLWFRMGFFKFAKDYHVGVRAERDHKENCMLSFRSVYNYNRFQLAATGVVNCKLLKLSKFDSQVIMNQGDNQLSLAQDNCSLGNLTIGMSRRINSKTQVALSALQDLASEINPTFEVGAVTQCKKDLTCRTKVNSKGNFQLSSKYVLDNQVSLCGSFEVNCGSGKCPFDFNNYYFIPFGYQIELNY